MVGLSDSQGSVVAVDRAWTVPVLVKTPEADPETDMERAMGRLHDGLVAQILVQGLEHGQVLAVLDISRFLTETLRETAGRAGVKIISLLSKRRGTGSGIVPGAIALHPREPARSLKSKLPTLLDRFASFSPASDLTQVIQTSCLRPACKTQSWNTLTTPYPSVTSRTKLGLADCEVPSLVRAAWAHASAADKQQSVNTSHLLHIKPDALTPVDAEAVQHQPCLLDWPLHDPLPALIQPLLATITFRPDKTYWLVGLTVALGQSLARWMVDRGARYLVLTSRAPRLDLTWLASVETIGAMVKAFPNDITDREAVHVAYRTITPTMRPGSRGRVIPSFSIS